MKETVVRALLRGRIFWRIRTRGLRATLLTAVDADDVDALRMLVQQNGADALRAFGGTKGLTLLHRAAYAGSIESARFLMSPPVGADVNAARFNNFTPLHGAAMHGRTAMCELLLKQAANPNVQTRPQGYLPLHSAAWGGHLGVVEALLRHGAHIDPCNYRGETPAQTASRQGHASVAARLI